MTLTYELSLDIRKMYTHTHIPKIMQGFHKQDRHTSERF